jgi:signal transduction histidine kinase
LGGGFHLLSALSVTYVMLTHALPDVRQMARRILSYLIITLLTMVIYTAGILVAQYVFQSVPGYTPLVAGATVALVLAIIFDPLLRLVQRLVNRLISGAGYDPSHTLRQYSASISNILDLEHLATVALGLMSEAMAIRRGILFVVHYEREGNGGTEGEGYFRLRGVIGVGEGLPPGVELPPGVLSVGGPLADYMGQERQPLTQYDIDLLPRFQETPPAEQAWLTSLNMVVYVPIHAKDEWIGLLAFGPKRSGDRYFDDDLVVLSTLADQTAVALENARLFDDLKIRNAENERLNEELIDANQKLALLDQAKSDFIGVASHELRTPLTHIRGYNDMLADMLDAGALSPEGGMKLTEGVSKGIRRLEEIVNTMFDVSKIDTETLDLNTAPTSVAAVVGTVVDNFGEALEDRQQTLTVVEGLADLPAIMGDRDRLTQVFSHLVQNAIKYTPDEGQITITGRLLQDERMQPQDQAIEIVVADTGIGIAPDDLERLFEKFYRVGDARLHSTGQTKFKGAGPGLGLTIARGVVEAHGGRIWAESPGYDEESCPGSEFHLVLPIQASHLELAGSETFIADT